MSCRKLFESLPSGRGTVSERANLIDSQFPDASCELECVSAYSDSPVDDCEFLHRFVFSPIHMHDGKVLPTLFNDAKDKGLSCERSATEKVAFETHARAREQVANWNISRAPEASSRSYVGSVTAICCKVRGVKAGGARIFAVYDTALRDNPQHVDIFEIARRSRAEKKQARKDIADIFTKIPVSD